VLFKELAKVWINYQKPGRGIEKFTTGGKLLTFTAKKRTGHEIADRGR
jgi:hypothetical protein